MVVEVPGNEWNVDIAGFADGLAVVHGFEHTEKAFTFLDVTRQRIKMFGTLKA